MPSNIEIKARVRNFADIRRRAEVLSDLPLKVITQEDTFFHVKKGRLKLRDFGTGSAQLIFYQRPDQDGPKRSDYKIFETDDLAGLKAVLELAYGIRGRVRKTRYLYLTGQTRIHLDDVAGLGQFMELEVVLREDQSDAEGQSIAEDLMSRLGVEADDLVEDAYIDLLERSNKIESL